MGSSVWSDKRRKRLTDRIGVDGISHGVEFTQEDPKGVDSLCQ